MKQMTSRELFNAVVRGEKTPRPPFWLMRQAGRFLPEYRELKKSRSFVQITQTPELAAEATLQPIRRFGFDCAIIFSDILVVAEALGFGYTFRERGGIMLEKTVSGERDIAEIEARCADVSARLQYVAQALHIVRAEVPHTALYGFCGAPWTLACYMLQGENADGFPKLLEFVRERPDLSERLMGALARASAQYAKMQLAEGIDAFQVFDSHAGLTADGEYWRLSGRWIAEIMAAVKGSAAGVVFANSMSARFSEVAPVNADFYSLDASVRLSEIAEKFGVGVQGNLPPELLSNGTPTEVSTKTAEIAADMRGRGRHIFNLAHGIRPDAKLENVEAMCQTLKSA